MKTGISKPKRVICIFGAIVLIPLYFYCYLILIKVSQKEIIIPSWQIPLYILVALVTIIGAIALFVLGITGSKD